MRLVFSETTPIATVGDYRIEKFTHMHTGWDCHRGYTLRWERRQISVETIAHYSTKHHVLVVDSRVCMGECYRPVLNDISNDTARALETHATMALATRAAILNADAWRGYIITCTPFVFGELADAAADEQEWNRMAPILIDRAIADGTIKRLDNGVDY